MAVPRVFISSTFYDLQHVRNDLFMFLKGLGYEPVMHDKGSVTYSQSIPLEDSCYDELSTCDIVVCIIGNKYGTQSSYNSYSITMNELEHAISLRKKVYIYILKDVDTENRVYEINKNGDFQPCYVDDIRIHEYISELRKKIKSNPICSFETVQDITENLRIQFAGLFQYLLGREHSLVEAKTYQDLQNIADSIQSFTNELTVQNEDFLDCIKGSIFFQLQPVRFVQKLLEATSYKIIASTKEALSSYLISCGFALKEADFPWEDDLVFYREKNNEKQTLTLSKDMFDGQSIKDIRKEQELSSLIHFEKEQLSDNNPSIDSDVPF